MQTLSRRVLVSTFSRAIRRQASTTSAHPWFQPMSEEDEMVQRFTVYRENKDKLVWWDGRLNTILKHVDGTGTPFRIVRKLGYGGASNVWLAKDDTCDKFYVLKILNSNHSNHQCNSETETILYISFNIPPLHRQTDTSVLTDVAHSVAPRTIAHKGHAYVRGALGMFQPQRIPGDDDSLHVVLVHEPLGDTLVGLSRGMSESKFPLDWTKRIVRQVLAGLSYLHVRGIMHGDVHPSNIMCTLGPDPQQVIREALEADPSPSEQDSAEYLRTRPLKVPLPHLSDLHVKLVDLSSSRWTDYEASSHLGHGVWAYRSPERLLGLPNGVANDIWGLGCSIFEMLTGKFLFSRVEAVSGGRLPWTAEHHHLMRMAMFTGMEWPSYMTQSPGGQEYFDEDGQLNFIRSKNPYDLAEALRMFISLPDDDLEATVNFMLRCLHLDPLKRATADDLLFDPWLN